MGIKLKVLDRLMLQVSLPIQGTYLTMAVVQDVRDRVRIKADEAAKLGMKETPNGPQWNPVADDPTEFEFSPAELDLVRTTLLGLDKAEKLAIDHVGLYRAFLTTDNVIPFHRPVSKAVRPDTAAETTGDMA